MAKSIHIAMREFSRSSGGGHVVNQGIMNGFRKLDYIQVTPFQDASEIPNESDFVLCMGTQAIKRRGPKTVFWPLNVAMFDSDAIRVSSTTLWNSFRYRVLRFKVGRSVRKADVLVFDSHFARDEHQRFFPAIKTKPTLAMRPGLQPPDELKSGPREKVVAGRIAMVSHLYPYKLVVESIQGFKQALVELPHLQLQIAGRCPDAAYEKLVRKEIGSLENIQLLGNLDSSQLSKLYSSSELVLFSSICENAGSFTAFDAIYFGKPMICSNRSSMPEAMHDSVLYVDPFSPSEIGSAIVSVFTKPDLKSDLEYRARQRADRLESWDQRAKTVADFLVQLAGHS
ncbi:MAG: glycosyltransferase [Pirellulales bacterium]